MRKSALAGIAAIALLGALVAAIPLVEKAVASRIKAEIERDGTTTVEQLDVGLIARRVMLADIKSSRAGGATLGRLEASGLGWPFAELLRGRTPLAGFHWGDPVQADRVELRDLRIGRHDAEGVWKIASLVIEGLDLARFDGADLGPAGPLFYPARVMLAASALRFKQEGSFVALPDGQDTFGVATISVERYEGGRMATLVFGGVEASASLSRSPQYRIAEIDVRGLDVRSILGALSSTEWQPGVPIGRTMVDRVVATGFGGEALKRYGISLGSMTFENAREGEDVLRSRTRIESLTLAPGLLGAGGILARMAFQAAGLGEVRLSFDCNSAEDRARGEFSIDRCAATGPALVDIAVDARIVDTDHSFWQAVDDFDLAPLFETKATLSSARLVLADRGLLERAFKVLAAVRGQQVVAARASLAQEIRRYQPPDVLITQRLTQLLDAVARFVERGGTLTVEARPDPPFALDRIDYLSWPGADLIDAFGVRATLSR